MNNALPRFGEFSTIDWVKVNVEHHAGKQRAAAGPGWRRVYNTFQNYIILTAVGVSIGAVAACLNIITEWLSNIRTGYCATHVYLNRDFCCWGESHAQCADWVRYSSFGPANYVAYMALSVLFAAAAGVLVLAYAPLAAGSGISEIKCIISGFNLARFLSFSTFAIKSLGLPLAIGSGLNVGKEGPSVHYAVCVGSVVSRLLLVNDALGRTFSSSSLTYRNILIASSAAGVAVAFGSPMGGVLFSVEEISTLFKLSTMWESYYCSLVAVSILQLFNPFRTGQVVMFQVEYFQDWHYFEMPFFVLLGLFGGFYGIFVSRFNILFVRFRKRYLADWALKEIVFLSLATSAVSYFNRFLRNDMTETMQVLFQDCNNSNQFLDICTIDNSLKIVHNLTSLSLATVLRMGFIILTYGCKVPAGIFVPSMACGATFGRMLGILVNLLHSRLNSSWYFLTGCLIDDAHCITPGTYAFLGAAAALSGITNLTVTVVIIMFELTGALKYILPTMIVVSVTKLISHRFGHGGIADQMIVFNGLPFIDQHKSYNFRHHSLKDAMSRNVVCFATNTHLTYRDLNLILQNTDYQGFPVIDDTASRVITGYVRRDDVLAFLKSQLSLAEIQLETVCRFGAAPGADTAVAAVHPAVAAVEVADNKIISIDFSEIVEPAPITVDIETSLTSTLNMFHKLGPRCILIDCNGRLQGLITRKDILKFEYSINNGNSDSFGEDSMGWASELFRKIKVVDDLLERVRLKLFSKFRYSRIDNEE